MALAQRRADAVCRADMRSGTGTAHCGMRCAVLRKRMAGHAHAPFQAQGPTSLRPRSAMHSTGICISDGDMRCAELT
eukprot:2550813-Rhodomonas_salina.7